MKKKRNLYLLNIAIVLLILTIIFIYKGIYPFGNNTLIWGDMHDQITAFYYNFYDAFKSDKSLLVLFGASSGVNFWSILSYYILSPFSFLILLVKRSEIYLFISVIIALKILLCSITCQYFLNTVFKKLPALLSIMLAIIYAFSGYGLIMYQITSWIDAMYMLPLIMLGLINVLNLKKPTLYIITLSLSLIFSFYVTIMVIIFIFFLSLIYLIVYKEDRKERKKIVTSLGISTIISLLLSSFVVIPSYMQISISARNIFKINSLLNSGVGPITDKLSMFFFGGIVYVGLFLLLKNYKKNFKFLTFYIPTLLIVLIPVMIEPINKIWHFGSYAFFPYRFGFITMFLLIVGAAYAFNQYDSVKSIIPIKNKIFSVILTILITSVIVVITATHYNDFQLAISKLTISTNHVLLFILLISTILSFIGCYLIIVFNKNLNKFSLVLIGVITISHIMVNTTIYLGIDSTQKELINQYLLLNEIAKDYKDNNNYRVKNELNNMIMNSSLVMKYSSLDHFSSLSDGNTLSALKKMGYSSFWVKTSSRGGNLFLDNILANKYIMTRENINNKYYELEKKYKDVNFYSLKETPSYGYLINNNDTIFDKKNSFEISNSIYKNITAKEEDLFEIINDFNLKNIKVSSYKNNKYYEIIDKDDYAYFDTNITVEGEKTLYLEILRSLANNDNQAIFEKFNIYINNKLYQNKALKQNDNGVIDLGIYKDETVNVKIELINNTDLDNITIGMMDNNLYEDFTKNNYINTNLKYNRNKIKLSVTIDKEQILMLPISYNDGYHFTNNGKEIEALKVYDNFIGIKVQEGINNIEISFVPKGLLSSLIISMITLLFTVLILKTKLYKKIITNNILSNIAYYLYVILYLLLFGIVYIGGILVFIISYFVSFNF